MPAHKVDRPSYAAAHSRLQRERGRASIYRCADCGEQASEWSYSPAGVDPLALTSSAGLVYSTDLLAYVARCHRCHRRSDLASVTCLRGHARPIGAHCRQCRQLIDAERSQAISQVSRALGLTTAGYRQQYGSSAATARQILAEHQTLTEQPARQEAEEGVRA